MSPAVELQDFVLATLLADAGIDALLAGRIYDGVPPLADYPHADFAASDFVSDDDSDCVVQQDHTLQLDVWTRNDARMWQCREIVSAICSVLQRASGDLPTHALSTITASGRVFLDPDGLTVHGVVTIDAEIEVK